MKKAGRTGVRHYVWAALALGALAVAAYLAAQLPERVGVTSHQELHAKLIGPLDLIPAAEGRRPVIDKREGLRWRVESATITEAKVELRSEQDRLTLDVQVDPRDGFVILRSGPLELEGALRARLVAQGEHLWADTVLLVPSEEDLPEVRALKRRLDEDEAVDPTTLLDALARDRPLVRARVARVLGRRWMNADAARARAAWRAGVTTRSLDEAPYCAHKLLGAVLFLQLSARDLEAAAETLERLEALGTRFPDEVLAEDREELRAMLEWSQGRLQNSLRHLERARSMAYRVSDEVAMVRTEQITGMLLGNLGRFEAALAALEHALKIADGRKFGFSALVNLAATHLSSTEAGVRPESWAALGRRFEETYEAVKGKRPAGILGWIAAQRAYVAIRDGDLDTAEAWLARIEDWRPKALGNQEGFIRLVQAELTLRRGDLALAEQRLRALVDDLQQRQPGATRDEVVARVLLAEIAADGAERDRRLEAAWARALVAARRLGTPDAQSHYLSLAQDLPGRLMQARLRAGDPEGAATVILQGPQLIWASLGAARKLADDPSRYREAQRLWHKAQEAHCGLVRPEQRPSCEATREQWAAEAAAIEHSLLWTSEASAKTERRQLSDLMAQLPDAQAILLTSEVGDDEARFLIESDGLSVARGDIPAAWITKMASLERLFVLGSADVAGLETPEGPLGTRVPIVRWAGPGGAPRVAGEAALVVADPTGELPNSYRLGDSLASTLDADRLLGPAATLEATQDNLRQRPLGVFAFLGHGRVSDQAHWSTSLRLFDGELDAYGLLTLPKTPRIVALVGCSTGRTPRGHGAGLPEVLVQRGSEAVLATVEQIEDGAGERLVQTFLQESRRVPPAEAYRRACAAAHEAKDDSWRAFALWQGFPSQ